MSVSFLGAQNLVPKKNKLEGFGQIDFLSIKMPDQHEPDMDFTGVHYNLKLNHWSYAGVGFYGSVGGIRGGFFTLGLNAGIQKYLSKNIFIDAGIHFGGGGGASAPDGGGAFILPHLNLGYNFKQFSLTAGYSYINFFDRGDIKNDQIYVAAHIPIGLETAKFDEREFNFSNELISSSDWNTNTKRLSLLVHLNNLSPTGKSKTIGGNSLKGKTIRLAGFEINSYLNKNILFFAKADGAYHGIKAGYMDIILGAGYHLSMNKNKTNILAKFGIGAGGGGGVDTKGGFLIYPDISLEQKLFDNVYASINKGYLMSPDSYFKSSTLGLGLKYYIDTNGTENKTNFTNVTFKGLQTILKHDIYFGAARDTNVNLTMHQIALQVNLFVNKHLYIAGQTAFANFGDAGAYAEGIVGLGYLSKSYLSNKISLFGQVLAGAAGGGGISTGEGLIIKPSIGINYDLTSDLKLRAAYGYVKAYKGELSNSMLNFGISYDFSYLLAK